MQLREQYTLVIGGLVGASLMVLGAGLLVEQRRYAQEFGEVAAANLGDTLERQIEKHGIALAAAMAERLVVPMAASDQVQIVDVAEDHTNFPDVIAAVVVDAQGQPIAASPLLGDNAGDRINAAWVRESLASDTPSSMRDGAILRIVAPVNGRGRVLGAAVIDFAMGGIQDDIQLEQARLNGLIRMQSQAFTLTGVTLGIALVSLSILSAVGVAGGLSRPIVAFAGRARRIGRGELVQSRRLHRNDEIGDLSRAFDEMAATLRQTTVSKDYFDNVLRSMADMLLVTDAFGRVVTANPSCLAELGCDEAALRGMRIETLLPRLERLPDGSPSPADAPSWLPLIKPGGGSLPVRVSAAPLRGADGAPSGCVFVLQNVADRLAAETHIERSLAEKEILLREIHHRVKNNLQIISSMLNLQADRSADPEAREVFHESEIRIRAMALVHEQLYRSGDLAHVDLAGYLDTLAQQVIRYFGRGNCRVEVRVDDAVRDVSVDQAIPLGLIVNELVANSVQHGLAESRSGTIHVRLTGDADASELSVADDGVGFPPGFNVEASDGLGLSLVQALTGQLGGELRLPSDGGARCVVKLPRLGSRASENRASDASAGDLRRRGGGLAAA